MVTLPHCGGEGRGRGGGAPDIGLNEGGIWRQDQTTRFKVLFYIILYCIYYILHIVFILNVFLSLFRS